MLSRDVCEVKLQWLRALLIKLHLQGGRTEDLKKPVVIFFATSDGRNLFSLCLAWMRLMLVCSGVLKSNDGSILIGA